MTSVKIECPKCHRTYKIEEKILGKKVTCATEGCGTKFIAELPLQAEAVAPTEISTVPETLPLPEGSEGPGREPPVPENPAPEQSATDDPFGDLDPELLNPLPRSRASSQTDDEIGALPPPLPKRRTAPSAPVITDERPKSKSGPSGKLILTLLCLAIVGVSSRIGFIYFARTISSARKETSPLAELLYHTDSTLRLMRITDDAKLARDSINQWTALRKALPKSDEMELSLGVIEGYLNQLYEREYKTNSKTKDIPVEVLATSRWSDIDAVIQPIRTAQTRLMHIAKISWKEAQRSDLYLSTLGLLRDEARRIIADSEVGKNGLPSPLSDVEFQSITKKLDLLYSKIPQELQSVLLRSAADEFTVPYSLQSYQESADAWKIHLAACGVLRARTKVPVAQNTLQSKTDVLNFSESYASTLKDLKFESR